MVSPYRICGSNQQLTGINGHVVQMDHSLEYTSFGGLSHMALMFYDGLYSDIFGIDHTDLLIFQYPCHYLANR